MQLYKMPHIKLSCCLCICCMMPLGNNSNHAGIANTAQVFHKHIPCIMQVLVLLARGASRVHRNAWPRLSNALYTRANSAVKLMDTQEDHGGRDMQQCLLAHYVHSHQESLGCASVSRCVQCPCVITDVWISSCNVHQPHSVCKESLQLCSVFPLEQLPWNVMFVLLILGKPACVQNMLGQGSQLLHAMVCGLCMFNFRGLGLHDRLEVYAEQAMPLSLQQNIVQLTACCMCSGHLTKTIVLVTHE